MEVISAITALSTDINNLSIEIYDEIKELSVELKNDINILEQKHDSELINLSGEIYNKFFIKNGDNLISGNNVYNGLQEFETIKSNIISSDYFYSSFSKIMDIGTYHLSDSIYVEEEFGSIYSAIT